METNPELTRILELANKNIKVDVISVFYMFKKLETFQDVKKD